MPLKRFARPRSRPETFGLSTLDTVTCALGGAFVLLIFMAALTDPKAELTVDRQRTLDDSGRVELQEAAAWTDAADPNAEALDNIAALIVDYDRPLRDATKIGVARPAVGCKKLRYAVSRDSRANYSREAKPRPAQRLAITLWLEKSGPTCNSVVIELPPTGDSRIGCVVRLVAGRHWQIRDYPRACIDRLRLVSNEGVVFFLPRVP